MRCLQSGGGNRLPWPASSCRSLSRGRQMSQQIDIAVDLGVVPTPLPEILNLRQLVEAATAPPQLLIDGVLHQGSKMILGGTSKSNKSWCLLDLAVSVASGQK